MPVSYFPPLPQNIWGNIVGDINNQTDLNTKIETKIIERKDNLLINSDFDVNQRGSKILNIISRERTSNVATLETEYPHGFESGDNVQISNLSTSDYNKTSGTNITVISDTEFSYSATGADETNTTDSGKCLLLNRSSRTLSNTDFLADRWLANTESNGQLITTFSDGIEIINKSAKKFALIQTVPNGIHVPFLNEKYSASFSAFSDGSPKVRLEILKWNGAKDNIDRNVISTWNSDGSRPILSSGWNYLTNENTNTVTSGTQKFSEEGVTLSSTCNNIAIMIVVEELKTDEYIKINNVQLLNSSVNQDYQKPNLFDEIQMCRRFFQKSYNLEESTGTLNSQSRIIIPTSFGVSDGNSVGVITIDTMYKSPAITLYPTGTDLQENQWQMSIGSNTDIIAGNISNDKFNLINDSGTTVSNSYIEGHYTADAEV